MPSPRAASLHAPADDRTTRLAELVAELTGCGADGAIGSILDHDDAGDALAIVAAAVVEIDHPDPACTAAAHADLLGLVHHGSLRRWERSTPLVGGGADEEILLD